MTQQPGEPVDAPNKHTGEPLFAPREQFAVWPNPAARAASEDADSDCFSPSPTAATELRPRHPPGFWTNRKLPSTTLFSATRGSRTPCLDKPSTPRSVLRSPVPSATMMEVNVVPSVVLHFHGIRSSLVSNLADAVVRIALDMVQRALLASTSAAVVYVGLTLLEAALRKLMNGVVVYAAFVTCEALAVKFAHKKSTYLLGETTVEVSAPVFAVPPTLPRLQLPTSIAMLPKAPVQDVAIEQKQKDEENVTQASPSILATPHPTRQLSAVRRRLATQMRSPFPGVNTVPRERRRRADVTLHDAKIRVGKAFVDLNVAAAIAGGDAKPQKPVDTYMVRVDCSKPDDKHMNPVVMWDFTATFEEFRKLEKDLRAEIKTKRLRNVTVPHLSTGAILFVQPELTQDVLAKRRTRLQTFIDALRNDRVLADSDAMRKFCQAL